MHWWCQRLGYCFLMVYGSFRCKVCRSEIARKKYSGSFLCLIACRNAEKWDVCICDECIEKLPPFLLWTPYETMLAEMRGKVVARGRRTPLARFHVDGR